MKITDCRDYRDFLKHRFEAAKEKNRNFSFQYVASKTGTAKSYLKLVIEKQRHATIDKISVFIRFFRLTDFEGQYLTFLFLKATTKDRQMKGYFEGVLSLLAFRQADSAAATQASKESEATFRNATSMTVHALSRFPDFEPDPDWICRRLGEESTAARTEELSGILQDLFQRGCLRRNPDGSVTTEDFVFRHQEGVDLDNFKIYKVGLARAALAAEAPQAHRPCHFHMMALSLSKEDQRKVINLLTEFRDRVVELAKATGKPEEILFLSNNAFSPMKK